MNYKIVITKNRQPFRLVKTFSNKTNAINYYKNLIHDNSKVKFAKHYVNYKPCQFHVELLSPNRFTDIIEWEKDELGRNIEVPNRNGLFLWKLAVWNEPEQFRIYNKPGRYNYTYLYDTLCKTKDIIGLSTIQNLLILDLDGIPLIITLKNIPDAVRLYKTIVDEHLPNILPFGKMSKHNRKQFFKKIKPLGIPLRLFYTNSTNR